MPYNAVRYIAYVNTARLNGVGNDVFPCFSGGILVTCLTFYSIFAIDYTVSYARRKGTRPT